jgi:hypothetical protein
MAPSVRKASKPGSWRTLFCGGNEGVETRQFGWRWLTPLPVGFTIPGDVCPVRGAVFKGKEKETWR